MTLGDEDFFVSFVKSLGVILASEIGDKTFFIAAILAMKNSRITVFCGAASALALMTILSAALGWAAPNLISKVYTHYAAVILFLFFGFKVLYDAFFVPHGEFELSEVEKELSTVSKEESKKKNRKGPLSKILGVFFSQLFIKTFSLTFVAEWGDRSQITTVGLAASANVFGVALGGCLGHMLCTSAAILGGRHMAAHINEKHMGILGGTLFLLFGIHSLIAGP